MPSAQETLLPDGRAITIRPITQGDKHALAGAFDHLGAESRYRRFLTPRKQLSPRDLRYLTEVDHWAHEALVAIDVASGEIVGVARYVRFPNDRETAELAVTVVDDWQEDHVGSALVEALMPRARNAGVTRFEALVLNENTRMLRLLHELGETRVVERDGGCVELVVDLPE